MRLCGAEGTRGLAPLFCAGFNEGAAVAKAAWPLPPLPVGVGAPEAFPPSRTLETWRQRQPLGRVAALGAFLSWEGRLCWALGAGLHVCSHPHGLSHCASRGGGVVCFSDAQGPLSALSPAAAWKGTGLGFGRTTMSSRLPLIICVEHGQSISFGALFPLEGVGWDSRSKLKYLQGQGR